MRLTYKPRYKPHTISGIKVCAQNNCTSELKSSYDLNPGNVSLLTSLQKIKLKRNPDNSDLNDTPLLNFLKDSSELFKEFELTVDNSMTPYSISNYKQKWKEWVDLLQVLSSKYEGEWIDQALGKMTYKISDKNRLLKNLINDWVLNELYSREIFNIKFDKNNKNQRNWIETALGVPLIFKQNIEFMSTSKFDRLKIIGEVDMNIKKNMNNITQLCSIYDILLQNITNIKQETIYQAYDLESYLPTIKSKFIIEGKHSKTIRDIIIDINIKATEV